MAVLKNSKEGQALSPQHLAVRQNQNPHQPQQHHKPNLTPSAFSAPSAVDPTEAS